MKKKQSKSIYSVLYKKFFHDKDNKYACFYCGDPADAKDHVPALCRVPDYRRLNLEKEEYFLVPSCTECNVLLSDSLQDSILDRVIIAHGLLEEKYKKLLKGKKWNKQMIEDAELDGNLRLYIEGHTRVRSQIEARIDYWKGYNAILNRENK